MDCETFGAGDTYLIKNFLELDLFDNCKNEIEWKNITNRGSYVPRLVAIHGTINNDVIPLYRHPADDLPILTEWTPSTLLVKNAIEQKFKQNINHSLNQYYRTSTDNIAEHSDKTLDIEHDSIIFNYSLGAMRTMILKNKTKNNDNTHTTQRIQLPHNSLLVFGPKTNREWLHSIRPDRRPNTLKLKEELAYGSERISLTMRSIATFLNKKTGIITGQGAPKNDICDIDTKTESIKLVTAFSKENHDSNFDWNLNYGGGFNVIDFKSLE
jgi:alkylated DNA repair dioxygenase AlkB